jgi:hypothetical protein
VVVAVDGGGSGLEARDHGHVDGVALGDLRQRLAGRAPTLAADSWPARRRYALPQISGQTLRIYPSRRPNIRILTLWLAAAHGQLGQLAKAKSAADIVRIEPGFTIDRWKCTAVYKDPNDAEHLFDGLRKAGLSET